MRKDILASLLTFAILDVATDIAFLSSLVPQPKDEDDTDKHPLIGRRYIVSDNSYAIDKESGADVHGLHDKEYVIVSDPYVEEITNIIGDKIKHLFVDVFSLRSARKYRVLFQERNVIED